MERAEKNPDLTGRDFFYSFSLALLRKVKI